MERAALLLVASCCWSCSNAISQQAQDLATITLGADQLSAVEIDRSIQLSDQPLPACLPIDLTLDKDNTRVSLAPNGSGCTLTLHQPDLTLFDKAEIDSARKQAGPFDVDGIRSTSVTLEQLELSAGDGAVLQLSQYLDAVSVQVDDDTLLDKTSVEALQEHPTRMLPGSLTDKLKGAIKAGQPATADLVLTLWLKSQEISQVPPLLKLALTLQPELRVNVLQAL